MTITKDFYNEVSDMIFMRFSDSVATSTEKECLIDICTSLAGLYASSILYMNLSKDDAMNVFKEGNQRIKNCIDDYYDHKKD